MEPTRPSEPTGPTVPSEPSDRLYADLASWWPLMSRPEDYEEEAGIFAAAICRLAAPRRPRTLLELGSGGGNNASFLKHEVDSLTLVDRSDGMLAVSGALNPEAEHVRGDMRDVRLGRTFDAVFIHDAVQYLRTADDLRAAMRTAREHLAAGGVALFVPDDTTETYVPRPGRGGHDFGDRSFRYVGWHLPPEPPDGSWFKTIYLYLVREGPGEEVRVVSDEHHLGLFPRASWLAWLEAAGFDEVGTMPFEHSSFEEGADRRMFWGRVGALEPRWLVRCAARAEAVGPRRSGKG